MYAVVLWDWVISLPRDLVDPLDPRKNGVSFLPVSNQYYHTIVHD
jgi:hypothetical protein